MKAPATDARLIAVIGPTASGKTALGAALCRRFGGEIVSCDAKQVYRGMDIGTAKDTGLGVPQHLIDVKDPGQPITVAEYQEMAYGVIDALLERGIRPFLVGGSMLYAEAVLHGYSFGGPGHKEEPRPRYRSLKLGVSMDREVLRERIASRTRSWVGEGLVDEVKELLAAGVSPDWLRRCGQEYRHFTDYVQGSASLEEAIEATAGSGGPCAPFLSPRPAGAVAPR